ncbi:polysaccharide pyruvyl transferase family protein [Aerococcus urinaeequi]|uniref:polysaccharide pyruvyl transferase family protein n=1 Tax=Aerococcus urinaeequi TaxID=51665 RepID=UPI003B3BB141
MEKILILPSSSDLNRGDQALVWETIRVAEDSGFKGAFYLLGSETHRTEQSQKKGIRVLKPILKHPSRMFKSKENNKYNLSLKIKWGIVSLFDFIFSLLLLCRWTRSLVKLFLGKNNTETLEVFEDVEACFVKGGGFIHSSGKLTDSYTVYFQLYHLMLAQSLGKPVYVMPNSFGPFPGIGVKWLVNRTLNRCKIVTIRESISQEMLEEIDVHGDLYPDLGFSLTKANNENHKINDIRKNYGGKKLVAITVRPYRFPNSINPKEKYRNYIDSIVKVSKWLSCNGYLPVFVEQVLSETSHESDINAIKEVVKFLDDGTYEVLENANYSCEDLKYIYSKMDYTIGTRFHSVIFSISEGIPSIAIEYGGNKGAGILRDMELSKLGIPIEEVTFERLKNTFENLVKDEAKTKYKMDKYMQYVHSKRNELIYNVRKS